MHFRTRSFWLAVGAVAYACMGALRTAPRPLVPLLGLALIVVWLSEVWRRTAKSEARERRVESAAHSALRACHFGAALWAGARLGAAGSAAHDAIANLGTAIAAVSALVALARLPSEGGLLTPAPSTRSIDAAAFAGLLWGIAIAFPAARALFSGTDVLVDPLAIDYATTTAGIATLLVFVAASWRLRVQRRLEMGVADRIGGALALSLTAVFVSIPAAALDVAPPDRVLPVGVLAAALACSWTATVREPTSVSIALRGVLAVMILGVPAALFTAIAVRAFPAQAAAIALSGSGLAIVVGLIARDAARPLGPEQSRWLDAIERASRGALQPDPDAAIRAALEALRGAVRRPDVKPELWRAAPEEVLSVDVAGYLHVDKAKAPETLYALALGEPQRTLRVEALRALEVRRPDTRPLLSWFEGRGAFSATIVVDDEGPIGFLLLPRGDRKNPMTLEEARAARRLADRISALLAVSSALARSREREIEATNRADHEGGERVRLERILDLTSARQRAFAELIARPAVLAAYSPAARFARDEVLRLGRSGDPLTLVTPPGVDAVGWAAAAHLAGPGQGGPLVVVDGATSASHEEAMWEDPIRSPLGLADGGTLVVLDAPALPAPVQELIARTLVRRMAEGPSDRVPPAGLVVSVREAGGRERLSPRLAARLGEASVELPPLASRSEDLRALVLDRLAATGMQQRGEPLGIEPAALALLLEHPWPGNALELRDVLGRAASVARGRTVTTVDLRTIGFRADVPVPPEPPRAPETRRRRSRPAGTLRGR